MSSRSTVRTAAKASILQNKALDKKHIKVFDRAVLLKAPEFKGRKERSIAEMYDHDDLSACCLFAGNFINFGFWDQPINKGKISIAQRIESEKDLYRHVLKQLEVIEKDRLLEIACGQGVGSALALTEFNPREIHGIDFSKAQISRAKKANTKIIQKNPNKIFFQEGAAENIPYDSKSFEKVFSIEAAQHFENLEKFAKETYRILKPGGKLAIASFFGTSDKSYDSLSAMIQTVKDGIDKATPIYKLEEILKKNEKIHEVSIFFKKKGNG